MLRRDNDNTSTKALTMKLDVEVTDVDILNGLSDEERRTIYCRNLDDQVTKIILYELFLQAGPLDCVVRPLYKSPKSKRKNKEKKKMNDASKNMEKEARNGLRDMLITVGETKETKRKGDMTVEKDEKSELQNGGATVDEESVLENEGMAVDEMNDEDDVKVAKENAVEKVENDALKWNKVENAIVGFSAKGIHAIKEIGNDTEEEEIPGQEDVGNACMYRSLLTMKIKDSKIKESPKEVPKEQDIKKPVHENYALIVYKHEVSVDYAIALFADTCLCGRRLNLAKRKPLSLQIRKTPAMQSPRELEMYKPRQEPLQFIGGLKTNLLRRPNVPLAPCRFPNGEQFIPIGDIRPTSNRGQNLPPRPVTDHLWNQNSGFRSYQRNYNVPEQSVQVNDLYGRNIPSPNWMQKPYAMNTKDRKSGEFAPRNDGIPNYESRNERVFRDGSKQSANSQAGQLNSGGSNHTSPTLETGTQGRADIPRIVPLFRDRQTVNDNWSAIRERNAVRQAMYQQPNGTAAAFRNIPLGMNSASAPNDDAAAQAGDNESRNATLGNGPRRANGPRTRGNGTQGWQYGRFQVPRGAHRGCSTAHGTEVGGRARGGGPGRARGIGRGRSAVLRGDPSKSNYYFQRTQPRMNASQETQAWRGRMGCSHRGCGFRPIERAADSLRGHAPQRENEVVGEAPRSEPSAGGV